MTKIASGDAVATMPGVEKLGNLGSRAQTSNGPVRPSLVIPSNATILMAVHDFEARSPDELTLHKGDHIELLERDGTRSF
ncbi:hypothetical protein BDD12DRAFT_882373 [Trichophaea hybrida]|nr:hypothetical protein BDD12DRAFT_882373 [Trichophaea hybrida]